MTTADTVSVLIPCKNAAPFLAETLESALGRSAFKRAAPSFFSWLGVSMYLPREANLNALRSIAASAAPGSELVFTYLDQAGFENRGQSASAAAHQLAATVSSVGEPFLSGFHPHELANDLASCGLELLEDFSDQELVARYDPEGRNRLGGSGGSHVARARVRG